MSYPVPAPPPSRSLKAIRGLAATQLALGSLLVPMEIASIVISVSWARWGPDPGAISGVFGALLLIASGACGVASIRAHAFPGRVQCCVVAFLVLSVIGSLWSIAMVIIDSVFASSYSWMGWSYNFDYNYGSGNYNGSGNSYYTWLYYYGGVLMGMRITAAVLFFVTFLMAVIGSAFSCAFLCCRQAVHVHQYPVMNAPQQYLVPQMYPTNTQMVYGVPPPNNVVGDQMTKH